MRIGDAIDQVQAFKGARLAGAIHRLEQGLLGKRPAEIGQANTASAIDLDLLLAAAAVKRAIAQIDVVIQSAGIASRACIRPGLICIWEFVSC